MDRRTSFLREPIEAPLAKSVDTVARYRTIFVSDMHLGTRGCQAALILDFLRNNDADTIYLVGDIIDGWRFRKTGYWPQAHNDVIQKLLRKVRHRGTLKVDWMFTFACAAYNLVRMRNLMAAGVPAR